jgi:tRNA (cytidine/uridine-2'-O-)-methyltransferase
LVDSFEEIEAILGPERLWLFSTNGTTPYTQASFQPGAALVFGSEGRGLAQSIRDRYPERTLRIPMSPAARSLNLASAAAVAAYEAARQLGFSHA